MRWIFILLVLISTKLAAVDPFVVYACPACGQRSVMQAMRLLCQEELVLRSRGWHLSGSELRCRFAESKGRHPTAFSWSQRRLDALVDKGYKVVLLIRDPRDQLVLMRNSFQEGQFEEVDVALMQDPQDQLTELMTGSHYGWCPAEAVIRVGYERVTNLPDGTWRIVKLEDLVGENGAEELIALADFLGAEVDPSKAEQVKKRLGRVNVGIWKEAFTSEQERYFNRRYETLMYELQYD